MSGEPTVKVFELDEAPETVTVIGPVAAPVGTGVTMLMLFQLVGVAATPLKVIVLLACVVPKLAPLIVTGVPATPEVGDRLIIIGVGITAKSSLLLAIPPTVTTTYPVVALLGTMATMLVSLQLVGVAVNP